MTTPERTLVQLPLGLPLSVMSAITELLGGVFPGAQLAPGDQPTVGARLLWPDDQPISEVADRLRHAAATVRGEEYVRTPEVDDESGLTLGRMREAEGGGVDIGIGGPSVIAEEHAKGLLAAFLPALDEQGATNYIEWSVMVPEDFERPDEGPRRRFVVIVSRPGGKTPHELRVEAEQELARVRADLEEVPRGL